MFRHELYIIIYCRSVRDSDHSYWLKHRSYRYGHTNIAYSCLVVYTSFIIRHLWATGEEFLMPTALINGSVTTLYDLLIFVDLVQLVSQRCRPVRLSE